MTQEHRHLLEKYAVWYETELTENILPFWMEHGLDRVHGGVYTCLDRDGALMDPTKSVWFQGRFGFVAAYAYNHIRRDPAWLAASKSCIDFIETHCFDADGHMFFSVTADGRPVRKRRYVFSETFAIIAMAEYALASGDRSYADKALDLFRRTQQMLSTPGFLPAKSYIPGRSHSITMILVNVALVLKQVCDDPVLDGQIRSSVHDIETYLLHPEYRCILESVDPEGGLIDTCEGRTINPGHGIETAWFLMEASQVYGDGHLKELGMKIFDWQFEWGWDPEYGGIINFRDCKGFPCQDYSQDMKFWWPQCETVIASLYAYHLTRDEKYLDIWQQANDWMLEHFRDPDYGEWFGYLHRDGTVAQGAKGNLFKGPFHIPRMLIRSKLLCQAILSEE
ncbi:MAG: AGE family epimerase/isomerase [Bacteroidales bacterium]|nr:AGE family epimerase/isomerase [Bacteroidales bacterium]